MKFNLFIAKDHATNTVGVPNWLPFIQSANHVTTRTIVVQNVQMPNRFYVGY